MAILRTIPTRLLVDPAGTVFLVTTTGLLALGLIGLPLAMIGWFVAWLVFPLVGAAWVALTVAGVVLTRGDDWTTSKPISVVALYLALGFGLFAALHSSEHIITGRDPGVYFITGKWVAQHGDLIYDSGLTPEVAAELDSLHSWSQLGIHDGPPGKGYFQFTHLMGVTLGAANLVGGDRLMFNTPAALAAVALLGVFVLARQIAGAPAALIAIGAMAIHPATLHFAKDAYSEWLALVFAAAGFWVWLIPDDRRPGLKYTAAGVLVATGVLARVDGWVTIATFLMGVTYLIVTDRGERPFTRKHLRWLLLGMTGVALLGYLDLTLRSPAYFGHVASIRRAMFGAAAAALVVLVAHSVRDLLAQNLRRGVRRVAGWAASLAVLTLGAYGLFVRPQVPHRIDRVTPLLEGLQARDGLPIDGSRTYYESSLEWFTWYQGRFLVVALIVAAALASFVVIRKAGDRRGPVLAVFLGVSILYLWNPSITPDHLWAMRRFLPIVLPMSFVFLAWAAAAAERRGGTRGTAIALLAGLPLMVGSVTMLRVGAPIATVRTDIGVLWATQQVCSGIPDDAAAIIDGGLTYAAAVRLYCDVPTIRGLNEGQADLMAGAGYRPVAVAGTGACLAGDRRGGASLQYTHPEITVERPPSGVGVSTFDVWVTELGPGIPILLPDTTTDHLEVEVVVASTTPPNRTIVSLGTVDAGLWIETTESGAVQVAVSTDDGYATATITTQRHGSGIGRTYGGYLADGQLVATCGGVAVASVELPGTPTFSDRTVRVDDLGEGGTVRVLGSSGTG
jgi:hypothetical protein